jgi:hypothetical protein
VDRSTGADHDNRSVVEWILALRAYVNDYRNNYLYLLLCTLGVLIVLPAGASATTFVAMSDAQLTEASDVIVTGTVTRIRSVLTSTKQVETYITVAVGDVLLGRVADNEITIREPGGEVGALRQWVFGAPEFSVGEDVLLYLQRRPDGTLATTSLGLGKYQVTSGDIAVAHRTLDGAVIGGTPHEVRSLEDMKAAIRRHAATVSSLTAQFVASPPAAYDDTLPHSNTDAFTYLGQARWNEADTGDTVRYLVNTGGDPALGQQGTIDTLAAAMGAWNDVPTAAIRLAVGGTTPAAPFACDGSNQIVFNDPFGEVSDSTGCGGVLAVGGYCSTSLGGETVNGVAFRRITEGNITFNDGFTSCGFWTSTNIAEIATHEIGHTLGIGHSSQAAGESNPVLADATMYFRAHFDGRGAAVRSDDVDAVSSIYPVAGGGPCAGVPAGTSCADDGNPCTDDVCDGAGICTHPANTASCDDGDPCTVGDVCGGGSCVAGPPRNCDDGNACTTDGCSPSTGACTHANNTLPCNDGNPCTIGDACSGGSCAAGPPRDCDDGNACTDDSCRASTGACVHTNNARPCNDGDACTRRDVCQGGACTGTDRVVCAASDACHAIGTCNPLTGICSNPARSNGAPCDDGNPCTPNDACRAGRCIGGTPPGCDDGNPCTDDGCHPETGACVHTANSVRCDDDNACTRIDVCLSGVCVGLARVTCSPADACQGNGICDQETGRCSNAPKADGSPCDDGDACTTADTCRAGTCVGGPPPDCVDGNPCTVDECDPAVGCRPRPVPEATPCSDGVFCNGLETCRRGQCAVGTGPGCDDGRTCTVDACDEEQGRCTHEPTPDCCAVDADCADNDLCTVNERCEAGSCLSDPLTCAGDGPCTTAVCDPAFGCGIDTWPEDTPCDDGDPCTVDDLCVAGECGTADEKPRPLDVRKFRLRRVSKGQELIARAAFNGPLPFDALSTGITLEFLDGAGNRLFLVNLPPGALKSESGRRKIRLAARALSDGATHSDWLKKLVLKKQGKRTFLIAKIKVPAGQTLETETMTWVIRAPDVCMRALHLECAEHRRDLMRCR